MEDKISGLKMRILFCLSKYMEEVVVTYNYLRKDDRPIMTSGWLIDFILLELIKSIKFFSADSVLRYGWHFTHLMSVFIDATDRHIKTGVNYDIYLTLSHLSSLHSKDPDKVMDHKLVLDISNLIEELNDSKN